MQGTSDVSWGHSLPPLAAFLTGPLVLVWLPLLALQEVPQLDQLAHSPITQSTGRRLAFSRVIERRKDS